QPLVWPSQVISAPGGVWTTEFSATVEVGYAGPLTNVVQVSTEQGATGIYTETSTAQVTPDLIVTKQASPDPVQAGKALTYTIRVTNTGNAPLNATITDILPEHVTSTQPLVWSSQVISAPGGVWTTEFSATVEVGYTGPLTNVVQVSTEQGPTGIYTETSTAQVTPGLIVTKQASPDPVQAGKALTYTIRVTNTGNAPLNATITDILPEHVTSTQPLVWPSQVISAPGGVWTTEFSATVEVGYAGPLTNVVQVNTEQGVTGTHQICTIAAAAPNQAPYPPTHPIPVHGASDVAITQTLSWQGGDPDGDPVTYTIALGNSDPPPFITTTTLTSHTPVSLVNSTSYYWGITATDGISIVVGPIWHFGTVSAKLPTGQITKSVTPTGQVEYGSELTYTLYISAVAGVRIRLYDLLEGTTFVRFVETSTEITHTNGIITGTLTPTPTNRITTSFVTRVVGPGNSVSNRACIYPFNGTIQSECSWSNKVTNLTFVHSATYLPLIVKNYLAAPDLVVQSMTVTSTNVQVLIKNQGNAWVNDEFWVDIYIDPDPVPTAVNQIWYDGRSDQGLVWGIKAPALPLKPGGVLTLTIGDVYYSEENSHFDGELATGTPLYAQVDSVNLNTTYGGVLETHEIKGEIYNNITGPVFSAPAFSVIKRSKVKLSIRRYQYIRSRNLQFR
ncbi:MAG: DUF11 domain-containing protein, partial [Chloroflexi bacterium]|nr:DUF11 domain-containing protein [Chloroflexota bacterium]